MDKNAIKKYAVWARNELIERVSQKADQYEISADANPDADSARGVVLTPDQKKQRAALIQKVKEKGKDQVIEEVAYTWFNRFSALRFMEVNNYLPSRVRVFTDAEGNFKPEILTEAIHLELDGLDKEKVYALKDANDNDELFKYLIITQCNALSSVLPGMFQKIADYTELLFPDNLLREGSVIEQMVTMIPEDDWKDQVQIIGWLYQYYNIDTFNEIYDGDMSRKKIDKRLLPAATQMFTPDWVVRYMVENSLGALWIEGHPNNELKSNWKYYVDEIKQEPDVQKQLDEIHKEYSALKPEDILAIDPCMGSGHILCYMFDVLIQIYEAYGYTARDAASSIVQNNLYGLDIDDRAAQLAYFSVMMKARQYDRRFLSRGIQPHVYAIMESNHFDPNMIDDFTAGRKELKSAMNSLTSDLHDAKEYGSILDLKPVDFPALYARFDEIRAKNPNMYTYQILDELLPFVQMSETMVQKYHVVVTNPPYLNSSRMSSKMNSFAKKNYPDARFDLAMVMFESIGKNFLLKHGLTALVTTTSWMFLSSFDGVRKYVVNSMDFKSIVDFGTELFEGKIGHLPIVAWTNVKQHIGNRFKAIRLEEFCYSKRDTKQIEFFNKDNHYEVDESWFEIIDGNPFCYWINSSQVKAFKNCTPLVQVSPPRTGMMTTNNNLFLRRWYEVNMERISLKSESIESSVNSKKRWFPYNKGGDFKKWYGNRELVVNWEDAGRDIANAGMTSFRGKDFYFREGLTWTIFGYDNFAVRYTPTGAIFDIGGTSTFPPKDLIYYVLAFLNSKVASDFITLINPTVNIQNGDIKRLPFIVNQEYEKEISDLAKKNVALVKNNYDCFETSWDFIGDPLVFCISRGARRISDCIKMYSDTLMNDFSSLKNNEEKINMLFATIYDVKETTTIEVPEKKISIYIPEISELIKNYISYAVGCMMGRYSLDVDGLAYAGGDWDSSKYRTFIPDKDAIIPITDDEYFTDDIVGRFAEFVKTVYGADTLEENLKFIADALDEKGSTSREVIRNYFLNDFYKDHLKTYQKRPIYWLFDSGKKNGFKCLVYMHRYQPDTIARIRTDYVHEQQARYRTAISGLERQINGAPTSERVRLNKQLTKLKDQAEETRLYEEKIHHLADQMISIDLDDGVKHNYAIFQDVLAKIK